MVMEVDKVADEVADVDVDKVADMVVKIIFLYPLISRNQNVICHGG